MRYIVALSLAALAGQLAAQTFELKNDRLTDGSTVAIQAGFGVGDVGAAILTTDPGNYPLKIDKVQIFWVSASGGQPDVEQASINIYNGGGESPPNPLVVTKLEGPIMQDGGFNEFDLTPYNIIINKGPFTVGLEFLNAPDPFNGPSLVTDHGFGCQAKKNLIYDFPTHKWYDGCSLGISGNIAIRVIAEYAGSQTTISGKVTLGGGYVGSPNGVPITVTIKDGTTVIDTQNATLDATGAYSVTTHNTGTHDVSLRASHWLSEIKTAQVMSGALNLDWLLQRNGDTNASNTIDLFDATQVLVDWGNGMGDAADVDGNNTVNLFDLNLVLLNFGQVGN